MQDGIQSSNACRDNWSLLEFVLLDLKQHVVVAQAEGRGWVTLDRPSVPGIDQWVSSDLLAPTGWRRIWLPTYAGAPNYVACGVLRASGSAAGVEAAQFVAWGMRVRSGDSICDCVVGIYRLPIPPHCGHAELSPSGSVP